MDWVSLTLQRKVFFVTGLAANSVLMAKPIVLQLTEKVQHENHRTAIANASLTAL